MYTSNSNDKRNIVRYYMYLLGVLSIGWISFFIIKLRDSFVTGGGNVDNIAINYVSGIRNPSLNKLVIVISKSGDTITAIIFTILVFVFFHMIKRKKEAWFYAITVLSIAVISQILKFIVKRPRPSGKWLVNIHGYSFPSGHSVLTMTAALLITYFLLVNIKRKSIAIILGIAIYIYASLVGLSRVYVGVHYISDVIGGWTVATVCVFISLIIFNKINVTKTRYIV